MLLLFLLFFHEKYNAIQDGKRIDQWIKNRKGFLSYSNETSLLFITDSCIQLHSMLRVPRFNHFWLWFFTRCIVTFTERVCMLHVFQFSMCSNVKYTMFDVQCVQNNFEIIYFQPKKKKKKSLFQCRLCDATREKHFYLNSPGFCARVDYSIIL